MRAPLELNSSPNDAFFYFTRVGEPASRPGLNGSPRQCGTRFRLLYLQSIDGGVESRALGGGIGNLSIHMQEGDAVDLGTGGEVWNLRRPCVGDVEGVRSRHVVVSHRGPARSWMQVLKKKKI